MSKKKVVVELTQAEAWALYRLAECAANTYEDAASVLVEPAKVRAGFRGVDKLHCAWLDTQP